MLFARGCGIMPLAQAGVMELVDVADSKSAGLIPRVGSSPTTGTMASGLIAFEICCKITRLFYFKGE